MSNWTILIVEDETTIQKILTSSLHEASYKTLLATSGEQALTMALSHRPDVILLDFWLPGMDGIEVLKRLREWYQGPILLVSGCDSIDEKVQAFDLGADDYITKPFHHRELIARIQKCLRQRCSSPGAKAPRRMTIGELIIDFDNRKVFHGNRDVRLTPKEYSLFEILAQHPGEVVTQEYLIRQLWGTHAAKENLRVHIKHIRQKIGDNILVPRYIFTESGIGYRLSNATFPPPNPSHTSVHRDHPQ